MMILISLLVASTLISLTKSSPLSYTAYHKRGLNDDTDQLYLPYLINDHILSTNKDNWPQMSKESMANIKNIKTSLGRMKKRIGSLSVVNSLDVLRERMLLELARRKAMQDQKQIDANRRFLNSVGKRSVQDDMNYSKYIELNNNDDIFDNQLINNQAKNYNPTRNPLERTIDWYNVDDADESNHDNEQSKMETNELGIL